MNDREKWQERVRDISAARHDDDDDDLFIYSFLHSFIFPQMVYVFAVIILIN